MCALFLQENGLCIPYKQRAKTCIGNYEVIKLSIRCMCVLFLQYNGQCTPYKQGAKTRIDNCKTIRIRCMCVLFLQQNYQCIPQKQEIETRIGYCEMITQIKKMYCLQCFMFRIRHSIRYFKQRQEHRLTLAIQLIKTFYSFQATPQNRYCSIVCCTVSFSQNKANAY